MKGVIINQDCTSPFSDVLKNGPCTVEQLKAVPHQYEGSQVTDYMICLCDGIACFPSKRWTSTIEKYHQKIENGQSVDYSNERFPKSAHYVFEELGLDIFAMQIEEFKKIGINPWLSFRMNDCHSRHLETFWLHSDFYHEHPEYRRVKFHPEFLQTNTDRIFDYAYKEVRDYYLGLIDEALERYDPYGIELDFMREIELFAIGREHEGIEILNGFMHDVYNLLKKHESVRGHELKLAVRVAPDIQINLDFGLDVMKWVQDGLIDMITVCARFESNDTDMPIKLWKRLLAPYNVQLVAGLEMGISPNIECGYNILLPNIETFAACAMNAYSQGADKVYFFNYFKTEVTSLIPKDTPFSTDPNAHYGAPGIHMTVHHKFGDPEEILKMNRRHIISIKDRLPQWKRNPSFPCENRAVNQIPFTFTRNGSFKITVGQIPKGAELTLRFAVEDGEAVRKDIPRVFVNSEPCEFIGFEKDERWSRSENTLSYKIPESAHGFDICPYIIVGGLTKVIYMEVFVKVN